MIGFSYVFNMLSSIYVSAQRSVENAAFGMKLFGMSTLLNTGLNYLLIFGKCGLPALGIQGAAVATCWPASQSSPCAASVPSAAGSCHPVAGLLPPRLGDAPAVREVLLPCDPQ